MTLAGTVSRVTKRHGAAFTIYSRNMGAGAKPWKPGTDSPTFMHVRAQERFFKPKEVIGTVQEGDALVTVDAATACGRPKVGDLVALGTHLTADGVEWRQVVSVYEARRNGVVHAYKLQARA